jgi:hypothetical protein
MCVGLRVNCLLHLSDFNQTRHVQRNVGKNPPLSVFRKIRFVTVEFFRADKQTDRYIWQDWRPPVAISLRTHLHTTTFLERVVFATAGSEKMQRVVSSDAILRTSTVDGITELCLASNRIKNSSIFSLLEDGKEQLQLSKCCGFYNILHIYTIDKHRVHVHILMC